MKNLPLWLTVLAKSPLVDRLVTAALGALVALLVDLELLDGAIGDAVRIALSGL